MVLPYIVDTARSAVIVTMPGRVTGTDIAHTIRSIYEDSNWQVGYHVVWNGSDIADLHLEPEDIAEFVSLQRSLLPMAGHGRDVIIAHRSMDEMSAQMYIAAMGSVRPTHLARSLDEAFRVLAAEGPS